MQSTRTRAIAAIAALPLMIALLAGCGAAPQNETTAKGDNGPVAKITDYKDWQLAYAKCMRSQGIEMADPNQNTSDEMSVTSGNADLFEKANKDCAAKIGGAPARPQEKQLTSQEMLAQQLKMAKCFRDSGFDMPDPKENELITVPDQVPDNVLKKCIPKVSGVRGDS